MKEIYEFKVKEIAVIINISEAVVKHALHSARKTMMTIFDDRCALINKNGICHQCSELNGITNPRQDAQKEALKIDMVKAATTETRKTLFKMRTKIVLAIDPLNAQGTELHDFQMRHLKRSLGTYCLIEE